MEAEGGPDQAPELAVVGLEPVVEVLDLTVPRLGLPDLACAARCRARPPGMPTLLLVRQGLGMRCGEGAQAMHDGLQAGAELRRLGGECCRIGLRHAHGLAELIGGKVIGPSVLRGPASGGVMELEDPVPVVAHRRPAEARAHLLKAAGVLRAAVVTVRTWRHRRGKEAEDVFSGTREAPADGPGRGYRIDGI